MFHHSFNPAEFAFQKTEKISKIKGPVEVSVSGSKVQWTNAKESDHSFASRSHSRKKKKSVFLDPNNPINRSKSGSPHIEIPRIPLENIGKSPNSKQGLSIMSNSMTLAEI
jgi:hypothetical protein